jgi:hypothetical protein
MVDSSVFLINSGFNHHKSSNPKSKSPLDEVIFYKVNRFDYFQMISNKMFLVVITITTGTLTKNRCLADFVAQLTSHDKAIQSPGAVDEAFRTVMIIGLFNLFSFPAILSGIF